MKRGMVDFIYLSENSVWSTMGAQKIALIK